MSRDLDYNLPHRLSVIDIKEKILKDIEDEQNRLEREKNLNELKNKEQGADRLKKMNYEKYFGIVKKIYSKIFYFNF